MKYEEVWVGRIIEEKVLEVLNDALLEINWEEKVCGLIDSAIENYDFDYWLHDFVESRIEEEYSDRIEELIEEKLNNVGDMISVDDYIKWNEG